MTDDGCELCKRNSAQYVVTRICCALRLIESTPQHGARAAMWAHLAATIPEGTFAEIRAVAQQRGLIRAKTPAALNLL